MAGPAGKSLQHPLHHLDHVGLAFAQVSILKCLKVHHQLIHLHLQSPLGIALFTLYHHARCLADMLIGQDHHMQIEKSVELRRGLLRTVGAQCAQLSARAFQRGVEPCHLFRDQRLGQLVVGHFKRSVGNEMGVADGYTAGNGNTVQREIHSPSPK